MVPTAAKTVIVDKPFSARFHCPNRKIEKITFETSCSPAERA